MILLALISNRNFGERSHNSALRHAATAHGQRCRYCRTKSRESSAECAKLVIFERSIQQRVGIDPSKTRPEKPNFSNFTTPPMITSWQKQVAAHEAELAKEEKEENGRS
jgi:hypothetical protein